MSGIPICAMQVEDNSAADDGFREIRGIDEGSIECSESPVEMPCFRQSVAFSDPGEGMIRVDIQCFLVGFCCFLSISRKVQGISPGTPDRRVVSVKKQC